MVEVDLSGGYIRNRQNLLAVSRVDVRFIVIKDGERQIFHVQGRDKVNQGYSTPTHLIPDVHRNVNGTVIS